MVRLLEAPRKESLKGGFGDIFTEESFESFCKGLIAFAEGKDFFESEVVMQTFKGNRRFAILRWSFIPGPDNSRTRMLGTLVDVTALRQTEEELRKFKVASDKAIVGSVLSDVNGTITYANKAFAKMHGYRPKEIVGKHFSLFHTEEQLQDLEGLVAELRRKRSIENVEVWHVRKDGTTFPTISSATLITEKTSSQRFVFTTAIDITERKKMEEALERHSRNTEEANIALRVIIEQIQREKAGLEQKLAQNLKMLAVPFVNKLAQTNLTSEQKAYVDQIQSLLENISLRFTENLTSKYPSLTPVEVQVARLLVEGKSTPEIARLFNKSQRTVEVHRYHLREKLGIKGKGVNLRTFLESLGAREAMT
jgi:PAS domain S-box-containing protein